MSRTWTNEEFISAVNSSLGIREVLRKLGLRPTGGNYKQFHKYVKELSLSTSHFKGQGWNKGLSVTCNKGRPLGDLLTKDSHYHSCKLKNRLLKEGIFDAICYSCGLTTWMGQIIPLELEHINGISTDNRLENLTLLCPNCHAQTPTYRGRNINGGLVERKTRLT